MTDVDSGSRTAGSGREPHPAGVRLDDPAVVRAWARGATAALRRERGAIDRVNVFPVADADTGSNLYLTLRDGERAVERAPGDATGPELLATLARAALLGARGNSGVILSEWLRGLAVAARRGGAPADLLRRAATSARSAVAEPAEGTILTAADAAADAAEAAAAGAAPETDASAAGTTAAAVAAADAAVDAAARAAAADAVADAAAADTAAGTLAVVTAAAGAARAAARASRDELDVLRAAGVLDAGALGLVLVLDALVVAVSGAASAAGLGATPGATPGAGLGAMPGAGPGAASGPAPGAAAGAATTPPAGMSVAGGSMDTVNLDQLLDATAPPLAVLPAEPHGEPHGAGALELMFVLTGPAGGVAETVAAGLRAALAEVGDSVVVVGGDAGTGNAVWQAHVHTDHLDAALAVAASAARTGSLAQVHVRHLEAAGQHEWGVVAATSAPALAAELARAGAVVLLTGGVGGTVEPLTPDDVGRAAGSTGARRVLFLGPGIAGAVTPDAGAPYDVDEVVAVVTPTDVHAVVALAALGTVLPFGEPADPGVDAHAVVADALAGLSVATARAADAADVLTGATGPGTTVVTALLDADVPGDLPDRLAEALAGQAPDAELVVLATGRPGDVVRLGAESGVGHGIEGDA